MAHTHPVVDDDKEFIIDPVSRVISHPAESQPTLIQHDHNSERFTFKMPLTIDGHNVTSCNLVRVHFINISGTNTSQKSASVYKVEDMEVDSTDPTKASFTWLIAQEATMHVGTLSFLIEFACVDTSTKIVSYSWHTGIYDGIIVSNGMDNSEAVIGSRYDILDTWIQQFKDELMLSANGASELVNAACVKAQESFGTYAAMVKDQLAVDVISTRGILTQTTGDDDKKIMSQKATTEAIEVVDARIDTLMNETFEKADGMFYEVVTIGSKTHESSGYVDIGICIVGPAVRLTIGVDGEYRYADSYNLGQLPYNIKPLDEIVLCVDSISEEVSGNTFMYDNYYITIDTDGIVSMHHTGYTETEGNGNVLPFIVRFPCHTEKSEYRGNSEFYDLKVDIHGDTHATAGTAVRSQINEIWAEFDNIEDNDNALNERINKNSKRLTNIERSLNPEPFEIDGTIAHTKYVPEGVLSRALVNKVGGMSRKCTNLFRFQTRESTVINGVTLTVDDDGVITLNGTVTETDTSLVQKDVRVTAGVTYTFSAGIPFGDAKYQFYADFSAVGVPGIDQYKYGLEDVYTFTPTISGIISIRFAMYLGTVFDNFKMYPMLNEGSTALPFEPFFPGLREAKVEAIKSTGKNLFNPQWLLDADGFTKTDDGYYTGPVSSLYEKYGQAGRRLPITFKPNTIYTIRFEGYNQSDTTYNGTFILEIHYTDGTRETRGNLCGTNKSEYYYTTNGGKNVESIKIVYYYGDTIYLKNVCIIEGCNYDEEGFEMPLDYEPYVEHVLQIPEAVQALPGYGRGVNATYNNHIEWDADTGKTTYHNTVRRIIFDGSEAVHKNTGSSDGTYLYYTLLQDDDDIIPIDTSMVSTAKVLSAGTPTDSNNGCSISTKYKCLYFDFGNVIEQYGGNTPAAMKAYLAALYAAGTPFVVDYVVKTTTTDITDKITPDNVIDVQSGGTITAINDHDDPAFVEMVYQREEV